MKRLTQVEHTSLPFCAPTWKGLSRIERTSLPFCAPTWKGLSRERTPSCLSMCLHRRVTAGRQHLHTFLCTYTERLRQGENTPLLFYVLCMQGLRQGEETALPFCVPTWKALGKRSTPPYPTVCIHGKAKVGGTDLLALLCSHLEAKGRMGIPPCPSMWKTWSQEPSSKNTAQE